MLSWITGHIIWKPQGSSYYRWYPFEKTRSATANAAIMFFTLSKVTDIQYLLVSFKYSVKANDLYEWLWQLVCPINRKWEDCLHLTSHTKPNFHLRCIIYFQVLIHQIFRYWCFHKPKAKSSNHEVQRLKRSI